MTPWRWIVAAGMGGVALLVLVLGSWTPGESAGKGQEAAEVGRALGGGAPGLVRIQYWEKWTGTEGEQLKRVVEGFNAGDGKAKGIWVDLVTMSQIDQKTLVAVAAGVPPDIAGLWDTQLVQFAAMDAIEPLSVMAAEKGITDGYYKPTYWRLCNWNGELWGLISTPATCALHWDKEAFAECGYDVETGYPKTIQELDEMSERLTTFEGTEGAGGGRSGGHIKRSGHLPLVPGWWITTLGKWFGADIFDEKNGKLTVNSAEMIAAFDWVASYSQKYGKDSITEFRSGLGEHGTAQNPFMTGTVAMEQQGPWEANFIETFKPSMNRWKVPPEKVQRERDFGRLTVGMSRQEVEAILGDGMTDGQDTKWDAGIQLIRGRFEGDRLASIGMRLKPARERRAMTQWGAAPFPSAVPGVKVSGLANADVLVIPRGSKHRKEAFEFMAYVNRQEIMEKLCSDHCKNSPLTKVSTDFVDYHPNPYIEVFEAIAASPDAFNIPQTPIWAEMADELTVASQKVYLLESSARDAMNSAQKRLDGKWGYFQRVRKLRDGERAGAQ